jgi:hypothetical protein
MNTKQIFENVQQRIKKEKIGLFAVMQGVLVDVESDGSVILHVNKDNTFCLNKIKSNAAYLKECFGKEIGDSFSGIDVAFYEEKKDPVTDHKSFVKHVINIFDGKAKILYQKIN